MSTAYILYNKKAGDGNALESAKKLEKILSDEIKYIDIEKISDYSVFLKGIEKDDYVVITGGDGTVNRFANNTRSINYNCDVKYYPNGTGNDFAHDLGKEKECEPFSIKEFLKNLPTVTVFDKSYLFINGVGYGIDGYCCEVGDKLKSIPGKKINYSSIAIKGLLFHFTPRNAKVTVDGKEYEYKKVWIAPTMNGRFYGGGMMPTPDQKRNCGKVSLMLFYGSGKLKTLMMFPSLFKGQHTKHKNNVAIFEGNEITIEFDRPTPLQIDGETILNVTSHTVKCEDLVPICI